MNDSVLKNDVFFYYSVDENVSVAVDENDFGKKKNLYYGACKVSDKNAL